MKKVANVLEVTQIINRHPKLQASHETPEP